MYNTKQVKVLQIGVPKSGNLWVHRILRNIYIQAQLEYPSFISTYRNFIEDYPIHNLKTRTFGHDVIEIEPEEVYFIPGRRCKVRIDNFETYLNHCTHVWTHSNFCQRTSKILAQFDKVIYIVRDPRDAAISFSNYMFTLGVRNDFTPDYTNQKDLLNNKLLPLTKNWVKHVGNHLKLTYELDIHFLFFERLLYNFDEELAKLLVYLEINLDQPEIDAVSQAVSFDTMKSQKPDHVRKGKAWQWVTKLAPAQKEEVATIAGPLLEILNYPVVESQIDDNLLPHIPSNLTQEQIATIDKAIAYRVRPPKDKSMIETLHQKSEKIEAENTQNKQKMTNAEQKIQTLCDKQQQLVEELALEKDQHQNLEEQISILINDPILKPLIRLRSSVGLGLKQWMPQGMHHNLRVYYRRLKR